VAFRIFAPDARDVKLAGSFNDWRPQNLQTSSKQNGFWESEVSLPTGQYEYKFVIDGQWLIDPAHANCVPNSYGTFNSVIHVN
jgi:1,4-alpha-glucan branching enzyme